MRTERAKKPQPLLSEGIRLNVFLQENGVASRRKADELISSGVVKVNGKAVTQLGTRISLDDKVHVHGKLIGAKNLPKVIYILNKPDMCLTTRFDAKMRRTIFDLAAVKTLPPNVQAVGRLDYRSEGLLLLTNDGDLAFALTHPRFSVEKTYAVLCSDGVTIEDVEKLRAGVMLDDGHAKAVSVRMGSKERMGATRGQWLEIVVTEGRNRLIRRMAEAIGLKVVRLVRIGIGEIMLPATLKSGSIISVDNAARKQLDQIKEDMIRSVDDQQKLHAQFLDEETRVKRKLKRNLKLNDEEYALEAARRSAEASGKRKQRSQSQTQTERTTLRSEDRPIPRARRNERNDSQPMRRDQAAHSDGPVPRKESRNKFSGSGSISERKKTESKSNSQTQAQPKPKAKQKTPTRSGRPQKRRG